MTVDEAWNHLESAGYMMVSDTGSGTIVGCPHQKGRGRKATHDYYRELDAYVLAITTLAAHSVSNGYSAGSVRRERGCRQEQLFWRLNPR